MQESKNISLLIFLGIVALFLPLSLSPLFDLDEGAFSEATREMLVGKDYITTYLNGALRFDKPILIYWLQLFSVKTFGINEFAFRLPSAIAGALWAGAIYIFTKNQKDIFIAFFATLFMLLSLQINIITKAAIADSLLNLFIACEMFAIYLFYTKNENKYLYATYLFMGLGLLTKGPVAIMIPFVVGFIFFTIKGRFFDFAKAIINPKGIAILLIVALPWYIAEYIAQGQAFIDGFFFKHNLSRFNSAMESHSGSMFYFVPVLLVGLFPFTPYALKAIYKVPSYFKTDLELFLFIWFVFVFLFFSFSGTKLPHYIVYGYTPIFILAALHATDEIKRKWIVYPLLALLILLFVLPDLGFVFKGFIKDAFIASILDDIYGSFDLTYRVILLCMIGLLVLVWKKASGYLFLVGVGLVMVVAVNFAAIPSYGKIMQVPLKEAALLAKNKEYKDIVMYGINTPSFNVYYEGLVEKREPKDGDIVFTKTPKLKEFSEYETLYQKNGFALIKVGKK